MLNFQCSTGRHQIHFSSKARNFRADERKLQTFLVEFYIHGRTCRWHVPTKNLYSIVRTHLKIEH